MRRWFVCIVVAVVAALFGVPSEAATVQTAPPVSASSQPERHLTAGLAYAYAYAHAPADRAPTSTYDHFRVHEGVDRWSHADSVRSGRDATPAAYAYYDPAVLMQVAQIPGTTPEHAEVTGVEFAVIDRTGVAAKSGDEAFHYTSSKWIDSITKTGLNKGSYATPNGSLSPLQASLELALPPNRALPDAALRIDLAGLRRAGYEIPSPTRVSSTVSSGGRTYSMPGGGYEMQFPYAIPPEFIKVVPR